MITDQFKINTNFKKFSTNNNFKCGDRFKDKALFLIAKQQKHRIIRNLHLIHKILQIEKQNKQRFMPQAIKSEESLESKEKSNAAESEDSNSCCEKSSISSIEDSFQSDESYYDEAEDFETACLNEEEEIEKKIRMKTGSKAKVTLQEAMNLQKICEIGNYLK